MSAPFAIDLKGRRALVTGASSGLGRHFAALLARHGADMVVVAGRRAGELALTAAACRSAGDAEIAEAVLDVTDPASVRAAFEAHAGIDLLVNCAGVAETAPALDVGSDALDRVLDTNLKGAWLCATEAARRMPGGGGDIVNIASILGLRVAKGVAPYAMSKAGVLQMTRALAVELAGRGIRVNSLAPGYVETPLNASFFATEAGAAMVRRIPARRLGTLADLDAPFLLLASGASRYLTGCTLTVDGGHHVNPL